MILVSLIRKAPKNLKLDTTCTGWAVRKWRQCGTERFLCQTIRGNHDGIIRDPTSEMVDARQAPLNFVASSAVVYQEFATTEEADILANDLKACLKRRRYEKGHWDAVIIQYKETELLDEATMLSPESQSLFNKVRRQLKERHLLQASKGFQWLPCHAIDLHKDGELNAHVDSVRFSGDIVAGLSLVSPSIMRLLPDDGSSQADSDDSKNDTSRGWVDLYLPPRSLYVLSGPGRFQYSHQILPSGSIFLNTDDDAQGNAPITVQRDHRLSVIFRDAKPDEE